MSTDRLKRLEERTRYQPSEVEAQWQERWQQAGVFSPAPEGDSSDNYSIAVPPPNVTGNLHLGHALNAAIQDLCMRVARMRGKRAKWIFGTDHAGIATQRQVELRLEAEGTSKEEIGRDQFVDRVWQWKSEYGQNITAQYRELGASLDYDDERFTMDESYQRAVTHVFVRLHEQGLIYRDHYMVNWDPGLQTAISDLEVEQRTVEDTLYMIEYPLESGSGSLTVATVRPETMLADTGIAVSPDDERYAHLVGQSVVLPLVGRKLPIVADEYVDPEFGTGALKITPGHDPNDFEIGRRHDLDELMVIGQDGRITESAPERFQALSLEEAQKQVVAALSDEGVLVGRQPYVHDVPHSHRSGKRIEPLISLQWFCDMQRLSKPAIDLVKEGKIRFHPAKPWTDVYLRWLEEIRPWCISRQLWWGHQLPVWYRADETHVGDEPPQGEGWQRDPDVLDTWFSSGLWPFATLGWPDQTDSLRAFYPTDVLSTAREIIFLWVARMVMFGQELTGEVPFTDVNIHSVIQAPDGRRMSKSLGTGIDPSDLIKGAKRPAVYKQGGDFPAYGADALRFGLLAMSSSQDVRFNEERVGQGRDLANKLWNASRLILLRVTEVEPSADTRQTIEDRWIVSRLERLIERTNELLADFRFSAAVLELYGAFWSELCDWYLELAKPRLYEKSNEEVSAVLLWALDRCLRLLHPVMPFVTEEIWSLMPMEEHAFIASTGWPQADSSRLDNEAEEQMGRLIEVVTTLRRYRDEVGAKASGAIRARLKAEGFDGLREQIGRLARCDWVDSGDELLAVLPVPGGELEIFPSEAFDADQAKQRIEKQRKALEIEIERSERKLANKGFVDKAPEAVVSAERTRLLEHREALESLKGGAVE